MSKTVTKSVLSQWQSEGKGARVRRSIGRPEVMITSVCVWGSGKFLSSYIYALCVSCVASIFHSLNCNLSNVM